MAELRNRVYDFAVAGNSAPTRLLHVQRHIDWFFSSERIGHLRCEKERTQVDKQIRAEHLRYHMGLAQVCKQIRTEFLPIYLRRARVAVCWQDLPYFQDTFYEDDAFDDRGPRNLTVYICCAISWYEGLDVLPLLLVHLSHSEFQFDFVLDPDCPYNYLTVSLDKCDSVSQLCKLQNKAWQEELEKGTFSSVDVRDMIMTGDAYLDLELGKGFDTKNKAAVRELSELLKELPYVSRLYSYGNEELLYSERLTLE
jgi:hypothetical protein